MKLEIAGTYTCTERPDPRTLHDLDLGYLLRDESGALYQVVAMSDTDVTFRLYCRAT